MSKEKKDEVMVHVLEFKGKDMSDLEIVDHGEQPWDHVIGQIKKPDEE